MTGPERCPACDARWANDDGTTRLIGIYVRTADRTTAWTCPDCWAWWERGQAPWETGR